ncbi:hypothetical protein [Kouleothrix sp.]|uniref:hypothetical protein n=1 Tax=Kouleothrix sp. TaxID=2779161 RepID=UPI00391BD83B
MTVGSYLRDITRVFFNWWWAAITGVVGFLPLFGLTGASITLTNGQISLIIFAFSALLFLTVSVVASGYKWYSNAHNSPSVEACIPATSATDPEVFKVRSVVPLDPGQVITVLRTTERGTGCLGIVKVERVLGPLLYQCKPLWIAPIHKNELSQNQVHLSQLSASLLLTETDLLQFAQEVTKP